MEAWYWEVPSWMVIAFNLLAFPFTFDAFDLDLPCSQVAFASYLVAWVASYLAACLVAWVASYQVT